nr:hypothetical protein [Tanacetum cinerariifolium]
ELEKYESPDIVMVLVGNKADLQEKARVRSLDFVTMYIMTSRPQTRIPSRPRLGCDKDNLFQELEMYESPDIVVALVGNKADLQEKARCQFRGYSDGNMLQSE